MGVRVLLDATGGLNPIPTGGVGEHRYGSWDDYDEPSQSHPHRRGG